MHKLASNAAALFLAAGLIAGGCDRATTERAEADAQRAGRKIEAGLDKAGRKITEAAQKTGDTIAEGTQKLGPKLERAGERIGEAAEKTGDRITTTTTRVTTGERTAVEVNGKPVDGTRKQDR